MSTARPRPGSTARAGRAATLLSTAGDEASTSLLPGFLAGTLGAAPIALGLIEGAASAADGVARLGGGALAEDPRRRRRISFGSHAGITALTGLMAVAASSWQVGALRAGASTARGLRSPQRYASVPERAGSDGYGRLFGMERSLHHLAAVAGPLLAFVLLAFVGVRSALLGAVIPGVLAVGIGLWIMRRAPAPAPRAGRPVRLQVRAVYSGRLGRLMTGITLFEAANFAAVLLILRATALLEQGDVIFGPAAMAVLLYLLWRLAAAASSFVCGRMVDRRGPAPVMSAGIAALLVSYAGFAFVEGTRARAGAVLPRRGRGERGDRGGRARRRRADRARGAALVGVRVAVGGPQLRAHDGDDRRGGGLDAARPRVRPAVRGAADGGVDRRDGDRAARARCARGRRARRWLVAAAVVVPALRRGGARAGGSRCGGAGARPRQPRRTRRWRRAGPRRWPRSASAASRAASPSTRRPGACSSRTRRTAR